MSSVGDRRIKRVSRPSQKLSHMAVYQDISSHICVGSQRLRVVQHCRNATHSASRQRAIIIITSDVITRHARQTATEKTADIQTSSASMSTLETNNKFPDEELD